MKETVNTVERIEPPPEYCATEEPEPDPEPKPIVRPPKNFGFRR